MGALQVDVREYGNRIEHLVCLFFSETEPFATAFVCVIRNYNTKAAGQRYASREHGKASKSGVLGSQCRRSGRQHFGPGQSRVGHDVMKAIVYTRYGALDVLRLQERDKPSPRDNEVLIRVRASSVNALDWRQFTMPLMFVRLLRGGFREPQDTSFGADVSGHVEAVGAAVTQFRPGDEVFGLSRGAFAEYVCAVEDRCALKPANLSFEAAAAVPLAALTALQGLRDHGQINRGQKVLVNGAGGGVGTFAVQIAKYFGAEVTAVCSPQNVDVVRSIGADLVIDYTREDFTRSGPRYDLIAAVNGYHSMLAYRRALSPNGICVVLGGAMAQVLPPIFLGPLVSRFGDKQIRMMMTRPNQKDLLLLKQLLESGAIVPVIDRSYPLPEAVDAVRYLLGGHARGKVVICV
jgi:NADPH:quinone reductase-like Zn-dependent oxidoreductase